MPLAAPTMGLNAASHRCGPITLDSQSLIEIQLKKII